MCRLAAARSTNPATRARCSAEISGPISTPALGLQAHLERAHRGAQVRDQPIVDLRAGVQPAGRRAILAGIVETESAHARHHGLEIGIVEHDDRRLAAELQVRALQIAGGSAQDLLARRTSPVSDTMRTRGCDDQRRADPLAPAADDVHDPFGKDLGEDLAELQRRQRCLLGGFEHDRVARGERRRELPGGHHQGIVPRRDRGDDAHRIAPNHAGEAGQIFARQGAVLRCARRPRKIETRRRSPESRRSAPQQAACRCCPTRAWRRPRRRASMRSASRSSSAARSLGTVCAQPAPAASAAATAAFTCAAARLRDLGDALAGRRVQHALGRTLAGDQGAIRSRAWFASEPPLTHFARSMRFFLVRVVERQRVRRRRCP